MAWEDVRIDVELYSEFVRIRIGRACAKMPSFDCAMDAAKARVVAGALLRAAEAAEAVVAERKRAAERN